MGSTWDPQETSENVFISTPYPPEKMTHDMRFVGKWRLVDIDLRHVQTSEAYLEKCGPQFQWNIYEHYITLYIVIGIIHRSYVSKNT